MEPTETKVLGKYRIDIIPDDQPLNPRTAWDNLGTMVCFSRNYNWGDKHNYSDPNELSDFIKKNIKKIITLLLYVYVHSGTTMSTRPFGCQFDSWCCGRIYITKQKVREEFGWIRISKARKEKIEEYLKNEVETYDQYLSGDCYGFRITDTETEEEVENSWGYYGEKYCMEEAESMVKYMMKSDEHGQLELKLE